MPILASLGVGAIGAYVRFRSGGPAPERIYIEDVFSTYLYTGTSPSAPPEAQTIINGIDLSSKGGMTWIKSRSATGSHAIFDTQRGVNRYLFSDNNDASTLFGSDFGITSFNSNGFTIKGGTGYLVNQNNITYTSWTFRKQPKFFDVVTYTGDGNNSRPVSHNLGSTPGCIIIKCLSASGFSSNWVVWHRSLSAGGYLQLNTTSAQTISTRVNQVTSTSFNLSNDSDVNGDTRTYVAYIFAHDAGGFGLTGTDNVISCGSYSGDGNSDGPSINLGFEPQWILVKRFDAGTNSWYINDIMRRMTLSGSRDIYPNQSLAEDGPYLGVGPTATGFRVVGTSPGFNNAGSTYIYVAIRRGPMKTPTSGTSVYNARLRTGDAEITSITGVGFSPDAIWGKVRGNALARPVISNRLSGTLVGLFTDLTNAENGLDAYNSFNMDGFTMAAGTILNTGGYTYVHHCFKRAPGFFDIVTSNAGGTQSHNLGVVPEMIISKVRSTSGNWRTYHKNATGDVYLNLTNEQDAPPFSHSSITSTQFTWSSGGASSISYLFASCPNVSKVGGYTGTGTTLQIDCGFTAGARYVLIKRIDLTGDWYVWDSERGIVAGNDPYLLVNSLAAEVTNTDYIDTFNAGFEISSTAPAAINANGGSYIFLAIA